MIFFSTVKAAWNRGRFPNKVLATIALAGLFVLVALYVVSRAVDDVRSTSEWTRHTLEVRLGLKNAESSLMEGESSARGYLLTGAEGYLKGYKEALGRVEQQIAKLRVLTLDNENQQIYLKRLMIQLERWRVEMGRSLASPDRTEQALNPGSTTMQLLRGLIADMDRNEAVLLAFRSNLEKESLARNFWLTAALCVVTLALAAVIYRLVLRESALRTAAAVERETLNASLEARVERSTQELRDANQALRRENKHREAAEVELQKSYELLETRVRERTTELIEANAAKTRFLSAASHDLRQPLHSLALLNATLRAQGLDQTAREIADAQQQALQGMSSLVHSLLSISMLEAGVVHPQMMDVPVRNILGPLRAEFAPLAQAKCLELKIEVTEDVVRSDPTMLREVIQNLLANAIRYTQRGEVRVYTQRTTQGVRIVVADTGPGIPKDQLERIFDEFHQIRRDSAGEREGFGLGLSIVKRLVKVLSLDLDVQSALGQGTTFSLLAPQGSQSVTPVLVAPANTTSSGVKGRILLVDDESEVRQATAFFLQLEGHEVVSVSSMTEAIDAVAVLDLPLDVIVTDFQLGTAADGADLIYRVRAIRGHDVPAVVLSGDMLGATRKCAPIPRCKIFNKPVDPEALAMQLDAAMAETRAA